MIGQTILHYRILEKLPSTEFILNEVKWLGTGGGGGMGVIFTQLDKSVTTFVVSTIQMLAKLFWRINQVCYPTGSPCEIEIEGLL